MSEAPSRECPYCHGPQERHARLACEACGYSVPAIGHPQDWPSETRYESPHGHAFQCGACLRIVLAEEGGCPDENDPEGNLCDDCWCAREMRREQQCA